MHAIRVRFPLKAATPTYSVRFPAAVCRALLLVSLCLLAFATALASAPQALAASTQAQANTLFSNIASANKGASSAWYVMELYACGLGETSNAQPLLEETAAAVESGKTTGATQLQRNIIALSAAGYDATKLKVDGKTYDAVALMGKKALATAPVNVKVSTLLAYASDGYEVPDGAVMSEKALIEAILRMQHADGGFAYSGKVTDADMTALAICALEPYAKKHASAKEGLAKAKKALLATQLSDGSFPSQGQSSGNANSTAFAITAFAALGIDSSQALKGGAKVAPLKALLGFATEGLDGFKFAGKVNKLATEQGFRALIACKGFMAAGGAYNIYTKASAGGATSKFAEASANSGGKKQSSSKKSTSTKEKASKKSSTKEAETEESSAASTSSKKKAAKESSKKKGAKEAANAEEGAQQGSEDALEAEAESSDAAGSSAVASPESIPWYFIAGVVAGCAGITAAAWLFARRRRKNLPGFVKKRTIEAVILGAVSVALVAACAAGAVYVVTQGDAREGATSEEAATVVVSLSIDGSRAEGYDVNKARTSLELAEGASVYDALVASGADIGGDATYVSSIDGLAEFACGSGSGWMYSVNGEYPDKSCGDYTLSDGDEVIWVYTLDLGDDL